MNRSRANASQLVPLLLAWYSANARDLPWRRTSDPYAIWVSEIMLQQTQVKTVIPFWNRWMGQLPTVAALAEANADKIHKLWEGLGYYTRVRNLQKAAQQIVTQHHGKFPQGFDAILDLPGIGRYTAGAICSIAFNQPTPILDGNVIRVLTRIYGVPTDPREKQTNAYLWHRAAELVSHAKDAVDPKSRKRNPWRAANSCSLLNQSLMELGALVCSPRSPECCICPVQELCAAYRESRQHQLPNLGKRATTTSRRFLAFVVERKGKFLVRQRPAGAVNAQLWEFPNFEVGAQVGNPQHSVSRELALRTTEAKPLHTIKHCITRYRITLEAWRAELATSNGAPNSDPAQRKSTNTPGRSPTLQGEWRTLAQLHKLAFTSAHKKILTQLGAKAAPNGSKLTK